MPRHAYLPMDGSGGALDKLLDNLAVRSSFGAQAYLALIRAYSRQTTARRNSFQAENCALSHRRSMRLGRGGGIGCHKFAADDSRLIREAISNLLSSNIPILVHVNSAMSAERYGAG